ncbi:MAG: NF038129 family PEP-CTERM protein [Acidobacteriia bacterium]|nr:NF038129 family PEP-CTERM protein [Terriglobia bacterium]
MPILFLAAGTALRADVIVQFNANTSSINGTLGSLDFQFNPGADSQAATVGISNFVTDGSFGGTQMDTGGVTGGPITTPIVITNSGLDNEDFETFRFGNVLKFNVDFGGPAVTAPNGTSLSTSVFAFSMFSDAAGTIPVLTSDPNGVAASVAVNLDGSLTASVISSAVSIPEPGYMWIAASGLAVIAAGRRWRG